MLWSYFLTEDAREGKNECLGKEFNSGTNGLTVPAAVFGSVRYNP